MHYELQMEVEVTPDHCEWMKLSEFSTLEAANTAKASHESVNDSDVLFRVIRRNHTWNNLES